MIHLDPVPQVWGVTGNLGGGKTLSAVSLAVESIRQGYFICSNVSLNVRKISFEVGFDCSRLYRKFSFSSDDFDPFDLPCGSPRGTPGGKRVLVILDEAAEWVDQYVNAQLPHIKRFKSWLRHSSKRSQDVIIIVQRLDYLQKDFRLLISKWLVVDDLLVWRLPVVKMRVPFMGDFVMQRVFNRNRSLVQGPCIVRKSFFGKFYDTAECLNDDGANHYFEYSPPRLSSVPFFRWFFLPVLGLLLLYFAIENFSSSLLRSDLNSRLRSRSFLETLSTNVNFKTR